MQTGLSILLQKDIKSGIELEALGCKNKPKREISSRARNNVYKMPRIKLGEWCIKKCPKSFRDTSVWETAMIYPARKSFGYISSLLYLRQNVVLITQPAQIYKIYEQNLPHKWEVHCHSLFFLRAL